MGKNFRNFMRKIEGGESPLEFKHKLPTWFYHVFDAHVRDPKNKLRHIQRVLEGRRIYAFHICPYSETPQGIDFWSSFVRGRNTKEGMEILKDWKIQIEEYING